tara:strand:- start:146 stop:379 length:234 start_codon:yes stop_codon:yes gene_type:complete
MPLKNRKGSGGFYKKEDAEKRIYTIIGYNKKTNKTWEQEKTTIFKIAKEYVDNNTKDDVEYYVYLENNSNRIIYPIG